MLLIAAPALAAVVSCAPRGGAGSAGSGSPRPAAGPAAVQPAPAPAAPAASALSRDELRDRLLAAGLGVLKEPIEAEDFELPSLADAEVKLSSHRGRVVFLNFWATWCPPCRAEMPSMERLHQRLASRGLAIVAVDLQEPKAAVQKFVSDNAITFAVLLDAAGEVGGSWGTQSIPTTYLIDRNGGIIARAIGGREWDSPDMVSLFEALLAVE
jgi:thiol-disulfide isomerase/thioredoxin